MPRCVRRRMSTRLHVMRLALIGNSTRPLSNWCAVELAWMVLTAWRRSSGRGSAVRVWSPTRMVIECAVGAAPILRGLFGRRTASGRRSGRTDGSARLKSRNPVCVELIGLSTVPDHQLPIRRNVQTEIVEHLCCGAERICR
jgi:hypothetical protein